MWSVRVRTTSAEGTRQVASALAVLARRGDLVVLAGRLGAGKTTFAQGFARGLGVTGPVTSPTFTLVRQYPCPAGQFLHADVYRLDHLVEVADLGLGELRDEAITLVEWGDVAVPAIGPVTWTVTLRPDAAPGDGGGAPAEEEGRGGGDRSGGDEPREIVVEGDDGDPRRGALAAALAAAAP